MTKRIIFVIMLVLITFLIIKGAVILHGGGYFFN